MVPGNEVTIKWKLSHSPECASVRKPRRPKMAAAITSAIMAVHAGHYAIRRLAGRTRREHDHIFIITIHLIHESNAFYFANKRIICAVMEAAIGSCQAHTYPAQRERRRSDWSIILSLLFAQNVSNKN